MSKDKELKKCPFNKGKPEIWEGDNNKYYIKTVFYDVNDDCIITTFGLSVLENNFEEGYFNTEEQAIQAWNTRTPELSVEEILGVIKNYLFLKKYSPYAEVLLHTTAKEIHNAVYGGGKDEPEL